MSFYKFNIDLSQHNNRTIEDNINDITRYNRAFQYGGGWGGGPPHEGVVPPIKGCPPPSKKFSVPPMSIFVPPPG